MLRLTLQSASRVGNPACLIKSWMRAAKLPTRLSECGVSPGIFAVLAEEAAQQWTGKFNPRPVGEAELRGLYEAAL